MRDPRSLLVLLALLSAHPVLADITVRAGEAAGVVENVQVEAAVGTVVTFWPAGADYKETKHTPFTFDGNWAFTWDTARPERVQFSGVLHFGDYFTVTNAGWMGGTSVQLFSDFAHHLQGTATWDSATHALVYTLRPKERDDGLASTVTESKPATCKPKGKACSAFEKTSPPLEGLTISFQFNEDLSRFEGTVVGIQYGGSGFTKSQTDVTMKISGDLAVQ